MIFISKPRSSAAGYVVRAAFTAFSTVVLMTLTLTQTFAMNIQKVVSPKGIEAWLVESHNIPLIAVRFGFKNGAANDPAGKEGLANFAATVLDEGAGDLPSREFQKRLEELAIKISFHATLDNFTGDLQTLSANRAAAFDLLRLALTEPRLEAADVERMRAAIAAQLINESTEPDSVAMKRWFELAFGGHPYARPPKGTPESVKAITRDDLRAFIKNGFARNNLKVAVVGDITADELKQALDSVFGALPEQSALPEIPEASVTRGERTEVTPMAVPQSAVNFGMAGLKRSDPDFIPAYILNYILGGGGFASKLTHEVREKRGLAYSVYTYLYPMSKGGVFLGGVGTENKSVKVSLDVIREQLAKMASEGPSEEDLENAKRYLTGSFALRFDSSSKIAGEMLSNQFEGLGIDYFEKRNGLVEAVTAADLKRVASRLLNTQDFLVAIVGQPEGVISTVN